VMSVFNLDQGMRSIGSIVLGTSATLFGASLGLALTAAVSLIVTTTLFYRLLGRKVCAMTPTNSSESELE